MALLQQGRQISKKINYDKPFKYSWDDILKLCKKLNINVLDYRTYIDRYIDEDDKKPYWKISWLDYSKEEADRLELNYKPFKKIIIDGLTGKIVEELRLPYEK